jgi:hypothetical protein
MARQCAGNRLLSEVAGASGRPATGSPEWSQFAKYLPTESVAIAT